MSAVERLYRRVQMAMSTAKIAATDDTGPVHRATLKIPTTGEVIENVPVMQIFGFSSHAAPGGDAVVHFIAGDRSNPVVMGTANQALRPRGLKPGEVALYCAGNMVKLSPNGDVTISNTTKIRIETPSLEVTGDIVADCDGSRIRALHHRHGGVQAGGANTGEPTP